MDGPRVTPKGRSGQRKRTRTSCRGCRERRVQCSRSDPCDLCGRRGIPCDWAEGAPVYSATGAALEANRRDNDAEAIRQTVSRVLKLAEALDDRDQGTAMYRSHLGVKTVPLEMTEGDLATRLSNLALSQALPEHHLASVYPLQRDQSTVVSELLATQAPDATPAPIVGMLGLGAGPTTIDELVRLLPSRVQAYHLFAQYGRYVAWMHRIIHDPSFWLELDRFYRDHGDFPSRLPPPLAAALRPKLHWIAVLFAVCGLAMYTHDLCPQQAANLGLPAGTEQKRGLGKKWVQCAGSALVLGDFMEKPSVESVKAMIIMAQLPLYIQVRVLCSRPKVSAYGHGQNGENLGAVLSFVTLGLNLASHVQLDVDPDDLEDFKDAPALVKQDRRRIMYALMGADWKMQSLTCKTWGLQHPSRYNVKLPLDVFDEDFDLATGALLQPPREDGQQQTIFTGLRCRLKTSRKWMEITIALSDADRPPTHDAIMAFDAELVALEESFPPCIKTHLQPDRGLLIPAASSGNPILAIDRLGAYAVMAGAHLRLHRGFVVLKDGVPPEAVKVHRDRVLYYGRMLLAIEKSGFHPITYVPLQYFVLSAAIALCVWALTADGEEEHYDQVRNDIHAICSLISPVVSTSSILRRSHLTLRWLLHQDTLRNEQDKRDRNAKRLRTALEFGPPAASGSGRGVQLATALRGSAETMREVIQPQVKAEDEPTYRRTAPSLPHRSSGDVSATTSQQTSDTAPRVFATLPRPGGAVPSGLPGVFEFQWSPPVPPPASDHIERTSERADGRFDWSRNERLQ